VLADGGLAMLTFIGPGAGQWITSEPWDDDSIGMNVLRPGQSWDLGGPMVLHSEWWIRAHWGRAFEVVTLRRSGFSSDSEDEGQGIVLLRKRPVLLTARELEEPEPGEARELMAARHHAWQLTQELIGLRAEREQLADAWRGEQAAHEVADRRAQELQRALDGVVSSRSWRLTRPLREAAGLLRGNRGG
jgi:hypothetical protein